ncbi:hypothetical protein EON65_38855 [archaeon]|nr:MAG: hypothetical protein EON65_38855 [archaeon]
MFAKPGRIMPNCRVADIDHTFTTIGKKLLPPEDENSTHTSRTEATTSTVRTGDGSSYATNPNGKVYIPPKASKRMYRILAYNEDKTGRKVFFDLIDGRVYGRGPGLGNRVSHNVVLYESKEAALSERFPYNQVGSFIPSS